MAARVAGVTWDLVGTLVVPAPSVGAVYARIAAAHGIERDAGELDAAFPQAFSRVRARWRVPYGADADDALHFWGTVIQDTFGEGLPYELICDCYDAFAGAGAWRVLPGVREGLALVAARALPQAVVSNFDARLGPLIAGLGLGPFSAVIGSATVGAAKPDPAPLRAACAAMGVDPAQVLHLGDHELEDGQLCAATGARWLRVAEGGIPLAALAAALEGE